MNNFFYETVILNGKETKTPYRWKSPQECEEYKEICFSIWGGAPYDVNWAKGTGIYKTAANKIQHA